MSGAADHFARVEPIVGRRLRGLSVRLRGSDEGEALLHLLAACGVGRWEVDAPLVRRLALTRALDARHGAALGATLSAPASAALPDLEIVVGATDLLRTVPWSRLLVAPPTHTRPCRVEVVVAGEPPPPPESPAAVDPLGWMTAAPLCAAIARSLLLRGSVWERPDLERLWRQGVRRLSLDGRDQPGSIWVGERRAPWPAPHSAFIPPPPSERRLLVVGVGSLGSVAAVHLAPFLGGAILVDPECVVTANPVRQAFTLAAIGRAKVTALGETLAAAGVPEIVTRVAALTSEGQVARLIEATRPDAALVVTGSQADFPITRALRAAGLPHVVGRCYPRARYWEAIMDAGEGGASFEAVRGHLRVGPLPAPTPEQRAVYSDAGALEAEPATLVESGWAAAWMARLIVGLLQPPGMRPRWLLDALDEGATCLIGGIESESTAEGPAYGVRLPGEIHRWRPAQIRGATRPTPSPATR